MHFPENTDLLKFNNRSTRKRLEICLKLTIKTPERRHLHSSGVFMVTFEHISPLFIVLYCWLNKFMLTGIVWVIFQRKILCLVFSSVISLILFRMEGKKVLPVFPQ